MLARNKFDCNADVSTVCCTVSTPRFSPADYTGSMFLINGLAGKNACQFRSPVSSKCVSSSVEQGRVDRMTYGRDS